MGRPGPSFGGLRPGPAHQIFRGWAAARPSPSHCQKFTARPGPLDLYASPARPMTLAAGPMRRGLYTGWPAHSVGRPVDLTGRATGRPMCCPILKAEGICADVFLRCTYCKFVFLFFPSGFLGLAHEPYITTTHTILPQQRPAPMASVPIGGPLTTTTS